MLERSLNTCGRNLLQSLNRQFVWPIPAAMLLGFATGLWTDAAALKVLVLPLTFLMVYPMTVNLRAQSLFNRFDTRLHAATVLLNFDLFPFVAFGLGRFFFPGQPYLAPELLMAALVPTSGMTIAWTGMAKGNAPAAVQMSVIGLVAGSLATPVYVHILLGAQVAVSWMVVLIQIGVVVFLPLLLDQLSRASLVRVHGQDVFQKVWAPRMPALSTLGVLGVVSVAMALKVKDMARDPVALPGILLPLGLLYFFNFIVSASAGRSFFLREDALALAVAMTSSGPRGAEAAVVISLAYVLQVLAAAWYVRRAERLFTARPACAELPELAAEPE